MQAKSAWTKTSWDAPLKPALLTHGRRSIRFLTSLFNFLAHNTMTFVNGRSARELLANGVCLKYFQ